jgi:xanthine dehydrogenase accessory factor
MKELQDIIKAYGDVTHTGQNAAIATVVKTSGSVYRRPGAQMLLTQNGQIVGAISGGCLESDIFERAQPLLHHHAAPLVVEYDTTAGDDLVWGLGLGCNGTVQVLIESLEQESAKARLEFIAHCLQQNQPGAIATVFHTSGDINIPIASRLFLNSEGIVTDHSCDQQRVEIVLSDLVSSDLPQVLEAGRSQSKVYNLDAGSVEVLIESIQPPVPLLIFGAGYDAVPVVQQAKQLGWTVTVIDHRPLYATPARFSDADRIICSQPDHLQTYLSLTSRMVAVIMTHNYLHDQELLNILLPSPIRYLGLLGPHRRTQQLLNELRTAVRPTAKQLQRLYGPVGLDLGAETPEEIALAIVAEIQAVLADHSSGFLRDKQGPIHNLVARCPLGL